MSKVVLVDYGSGNLLSVSRALEHCGAEVELTTDPDRIKEAERLVLPGVGAFRDSMRNLERRGLVGPLKEYAARNRPLLGICVGMQVLFDESEEFGVHPGLGLIPGRVISIPANLPGGGIRKIPHIGWSRLRRAGGAREWQSSIMGEIEPGAFVYFVHSYTAEPADESHRLADCDYLGFRVAAAVQRGSVYGCQFHPEKSGRVGLQILARFVALESGGDAATIRVSRAY